MPKTAITKAADETKLVTWRDLPPLPTAIATIVKLDAAIRKAEPGILAIEVTDAVSYQQAAKELVQLKEATKTWDATVDPYTSVLEKMKKLIWSKVNPTYDKIDELKKVLMKKMGDWDVLEEQRTKQEREREAKKKQADLDREAEVQRQKDVAAAAELRKKRVAEIRADLKAGKITLRESKKLLDAAGAAEESAKAQAAIDEEDNKKKAEEAAKNIEVESNVPTVTGISRRVYYKFIVTNPQKVRINFLCPDLLKIGPLVRACQNEEDARRVEQEIGGISIEVDRKF